MRHSVLPFVKRTSTRLGPLSCTSAAKPAAGQLDVNEIDEAFNDTTIEPPTDENDRVADGTGTRLPPPGPGCTAVVAGNVDAVVTRLGHRGARHVGRGRRCGVGGW